MGDRRDRAERLKSPAFDAGGRRALSAAPDSASRRAPMVRSGGVS
jgi:hypothetical protein